MASPPIAPGTLFASRWIVGGLLGKGLLSSVYEVEEARQSRFAALKLFDPILAEEPGWSEHVKLTTALAELPGDGIARAYDSGIDPVLGRPYVASERLVFPTLARSISERGPFKPAAFLESLKTLAGALDGAHGIGIVHGNLKPHNLFISGDNPRWARLTDFCVGRLRASAQAGPGAMLGWSAPEAAAGFSTPSSDCYALALLTFFAIVGTPWHSVFRTGGDGRAPDSQRPSRIASERASALGGALDPALDAWFSRALAADPEARFQSAHEMVKAFGEALWSGPTVEVAVRESLDPLLAGVGLAATARVPPVSLPSAGPAYASTLEMTRPDPRVLGVEITGVPASASVPGAAPPGSPPALPLASVPLPLRVALAVLAIALVLVGAWLLVR